MTQKNSQADHYNIISLLKSNSVELAFFFTEHGIIANTKNHNPLFSWEKAIEDKAFTFYAAHWDGVHTAIQCHVELTPEQMLQQDLQEYNVKALVLSVGSSLQTSILRAYQWVNWDRLSQYCGKCGTALGSQFSSNEKKCAQCEISIFPNFSPAVMILIYREKEILLARSPHFRPGVYSAIAGFIDVGETAEQAAKRETKEELGIEICDLEYFGSQPWPFPDSFMIAFKAKALQREIKIDMNEIEDAQWFNIDHLPLLPSAPSISRSLIESVILSM